MKTLFKTLIILLVLLTAASCTQYRFIPFPLPEEDDSTPYDVTTAEDFSEMLSTTGQVRLTADISVSSLTLPEHIKKYSIDLNGNTLMADASITLEIPDGTSMEISNGTFQTNNEGAESNIGNLIVGEDSDLILDNVTYNAGPSGIYLYSPNATAEILNSEITISGAFAVSTNAGDGDNGITMNIQNSTIKSTAGDSCPVVLNVPGTLTINESTIIGGRQAVILRSGQASITNSTLISNGTFTPIEGSYQDLRNDWGGGNEVPFATLVVGNRGSSAYDTVHTSCTVTNTSIKMQNNTGMDVYVASDNNNTVTFISSQYAKTASATENHYKASGSTLNILTPEDSESLV